MKLGKKMGNLDGAQSVEKQLIFIAEIRESQFAATNVNK
jgi:hypothetical protein